MSGCSGLDPLGCVWNEQRACAAHLLCRNASSRPRCAISCGRDGCGGDVCTRHGRRPPIDWLGGRRGRVDRRQAGRQRPGNVADGGGALARTNGLPARRLIGCDPFVEGRSEFRYGVAGARCAVGPCWAIGRTRFLGGLQNRYRLGCFRLGDFHLGRFHLERGRDRCIRRRRCADRTRRHSGGVRCAFGRTGLLGRVLGRYRLGRFHLGRGGARGIPGRRDVHRALRSLGGSCCALGRGRIIGRRLGGCRLGCFHLGRGRIRSARLSRNMHRGHRNVASGLCWCCLVGRGLGCLRSRCGHPVGRALVDRALCRRLGGSGRLGSRPGRRLGHRHLE